MAKVHRKSSREAVAAPTQEQTALITQALVTFASVREACQIAGVPIELFPWWLNLGRKALDAKKPDVYSEFLQQVEQAQAAASISLRGNIVKAAKDPKNWQASVELLKVQAARATELPPPEGPGRGPGRPTKFDPVLADCILRMLANGAWKKTACAVAGVDFRTFKRWVQRGERHPSRYPELADFARKVEATVQGCEIRAGQIAYQGALADPKLALEWLKVRHRKRWSSRQEVQVSGDPRKPIHVQTRRDLSELTDEELDVAEAIQRKLAARGGKEAGEPAAPHRDSSGEVET